MSESDLATAFRRYRENFQSCEPLERLPVFLPPGLYELARKEYGANPMFVKLERLPL